MHVCISVIVLALHERSPQLCSMDVPFFYHSLFCPGAWLSHSFTILYLMQVKELAGDFGGLKNLCSNDLSQSSWLSVAWYAFLWAFMGYTLHWDTLLTSVLYKDFYNCRYPIYRIPTGPTLKDLAACFLTYHSISTLLTGVATGKWNSWLGLHKS